MKYKEQIKIRSYDVDMNGVLRPTVLLAKLEELGAHQMRCFPPSNEELRKEGKGFILSRAVIEILRDVREDDVCEGDTWACDNSRGLSFNRCYELFKDGEVHARVYTVWALLDIEKRTLIRVEDSLGIGGEPEAAFEMGIPLRVRMPRAEEYEEVGVREVYFSDTDLNGHMNNTKYAGMLCDFVPSVQSKKLCGMNISYVTEAPLGERLTVLRKCDGDVCYIRTVRADGKVNCEAVLYFK